MPHALPHPYAAYLRVYEPIAAFPEAERGRWAAYADGADGADESAAALARAQRLAAEHHGDRAGLICVPPRPVPSDEVAEAFVLHQDGIAHVCPVQSRLRSWVALGQFRHGLPDSLLHAFVPPASLARADADHARWGGQQPATALRILTTTWAVPPTWFVPFVPADRVDPGVPAGEPALVLRTRMSDARRRVARALRAVQVRPGTLDVLDVLDVLDDLAELGSWLEEFHAHSWLELDYAGLARLLGPHAADDDSVAEIAAALGALAAGDERSAALAYRAVVARWAGIAAIAHAN